MKKHDYHKISDQSFEDLVCIISKQILGDWFNGFTSGVDWWRDGKFQGTAQTLPSVTDPRSWSFIIQSKHINNPVWSISDKDFFSEYSTSCIINKEISKLLKLKENGEQIDNYILFTNRDNPWNKHVEIENYIKQKTWITNIFIAPNKRLDTYLINYPQICKDFQLSFNMEPLDIRPQDIAEIIDYFHEEMKKINTSDWNFPDYEFDFIAPHEKAKLNNMTDTYFSTEIEEYDKIYPLIQNFITDPKNRNFQQRYSEIISALRGEISAKKKNYDTMDIIFNEIYNTIESERLFIEKGVSKLLIKIFLWFAFVNCDIWEKTQDEKGQKFHLDSIL
jgi:hypothetical protein